MKIGRNDACPCGSGLKYKRCCAGKAGTEEQSSGPGLGNTMDNLKKLLQGQSFGSLEEANAFIGLHMQQQNVSAIDDFDGLSSEQMHRFLHFPFATPQLVSFPSSFDPPPEAPILTLFNLLAAGIGADGVKATATGNLPREFCRQAARSYFGEEGYLKKYRLGEPRSEPEFFELHVVRLVAGLAGLVRTYKGKFILSKECRKLMAGQEAAAVYASLFRAFAKDYSWAYRGRWQDIPIIQNSFLFTLYLLKKHGAQWQSNVFYENCFLKAFPMVMQEVRPVGEFYSPEKVVRSCYSLRCLESFAEFLGLVEIERDPVDRYAENFRLRKLPLLEEVVCFEGC